MIVCLPGLAIPLFTFESNEYYFEALNINIRFNRY